MSRESVVSAEHRKPAVAFAILALVAATLVGIQRADAQAGRLLAAVAGATVRVQGTLPAQAAALADTAREHGAALGPAFEVVLADAHDRSPRRGQPGLLDSLTEDRTATAHRRPGSKARQSSASGPHTGVRAVAHRPGSSRTAGNVAGPGAARSQARGHRRDHAADRAGGRGEGSANARATGGAQRAMRGAGRRLPKALLTAQRRTERLERVAERRAARAQRTAERHVKRLERRAHGVVRQASHRAARPAHRRVLAQLVRDRSVGQQTRRRPAAGHHLRSNRSHPGRGHGMSRR